MLPCSRRAAIAKEFTSEPHGARKSDSRAAAAARGIGLLRCALDLAVVRRRRALTTCGERC